MDFIREPKGILDFSATGLLKGENVVWREKKISDLKGIFYDEKGLENSGDRLAYRVANQNFNRTGYLKGSLQWGVTYLEPFCVNGECSMTHGHFHADKAYDEYYFGISGKGYLLFWDGHDEFYVEKVFPNSLHYINGKYAHRIINIGDEKLIVGACSLPAAGHDYETIEAKGFPMRCFKRNGKVEWIKL